MNEKIISPLNRVEGDLDLKVIIENNRVIRAYPMSRLFRGIEIILRNKYPMDSLVITPRICGICGASHLYATAQALDMAYNAYVPPNGVRLRNVMALAEMAQNDVRHTYLMFLIDTVNKKYENLPFYKDMVLRWAPYIGSSYKEAVKWSKKYTEIYAIFGGQWPHGSAMVPGGVTTDPYYNDIMKAKGILTHITVEFLEKTVLGGPLYQFLEINSLNGLEQWCTDYPNGDLCKIWNYGKDMGWLELGRGSNYLMSFGHVPLAEKYVPGNSKLMFDKGIINLENWEKIDLDQNNILEFVSSSYYTYDEGEKIGLHPFDGETKPLPPNASSSKYTFTKAFRYKLGNSLIAPEVGAISMLTVGGNSLMVDLVRRFKSNVLLREIARIIRLALIHKIIMDELNDYDINKPAYKKPDEVNTTRGYGMLEAPRGSLGHWIVIKEGKIYNYQIVTPTQINMGPEDPFGNLSHLSLSLLGTEVNDVNNPIEVAHVVRSHDACMVCNVHFFDSGLEKMVIRL
ncbi:cytochrome B [Acidianus infernus]|uniref:Cytochrome B n=1 Tax=Acidianus infernus TaxID=12915 RepID=A0A6A9QMD9_ACIIN|nr:nickel-dependent hydrogenase large subunit [Acidianus infernus]MUM65078.1 cytochrome B [Acidianus infernus]